MIYYFMCAWYVTVIHKANPGKHLSLYYTNQFLLCSKFISVKILFLDNTNCPVNSHFQMSLSVLGVLRRLFFFWWEIWYVMNNIPKRAKLNKYIRRSLGWTEHTSWILFYLLVKKLYIVENRTKVGFNSNGTGFSICSFPLVYLCFSKFFILMDFLVNQRISRELDAYLFPVHPSHL